MIDGQFTEAEWQKVTRFTPLLTPPPSPTNKYADNEKVAEFGYRWFFEKAHSGPITIDGPGQLGQLSETGRYACVACHDPQQWFIDTRLNPWGKVSTGVEHITRRNAPSMVNIAYYQWGGWGGAQDQFWKQGANAPETKDLGGDRLGIAHVIYEKYRDEYNELFGTPLPEGLDPESPDAARFPAHGKPGQPEWEGMMEQDRDAVNLILANLGKAYEAYERRLISGNAPIDRYVAGEYSALSTSAKRGLKLFIGKAGCDSCHQDQTFTDQKFHNTGVRQQAPFDNGHFDDVTRLMNPFNGAGEFSDDRAAGQQKLDTITLTPTEEMKGQFRTKSLRQIAETGPYFHDGSVETLEEVVRHYNAGGASDSFPGTKDPLMVPLNLSDGEILDLVAFLESLTGEPVPERWTRDPFAQ